MKKVISTIIYIMFTLILTSNAALAQLSYTIEDRNDDIPGLEPIEDTIFYKFNNDGQEYYMSKTSGAIREYNSEVFNLFVKTLKNNTYELLGEYYVIYENDISFEDAINSDRGKYCHSTVKFYNEQLELVKECQFTGYIRSIYYRNGKYYCSIMSNNAWLTSTDLEHWEWDYQDLPSISRDDKIRQWNGIYIVDEYMEKDQSILINYMSYDGDAFYEIKYEKDCNQINTRTKYIIRQQRNFSGEESLLGISKDNIYFTYLDLSSFEFGHEEKRGVWANRIFYIGDYLYLEVEEVLPFKMSGEEQSIRIKIPLQDIENELSSASNAPRVIYDNTILGFEQPPVIQDDRTLIPIRFLFEQMGATVDWDGDTQTATITQDNTAVAFSIDDTEADVNGKTVSMDVPARLINGKTMVPVRFLSENLGYDVDWDGETRIITIE